MLLLLHYFPVLNQVRHTLLLRAFAPAVPSASDQCGSLPPSGLSTDITLSVRPVVTFRFSTATPYLCLIFYMVPTEYVAILSVKLYIPCLTREEFTRKWWQELLLWRTAGSGGRLKFIFFFFFLIATLLSVLPKKKKNQSD